MIKHRAEVCEDDKIDNALVITFAIHIFKPYCFTLMIISDTSATLNFLTLCYDDCLVVV